MIQPETDPREAALQYSVDKKAELDRARQTLGLGLDLIDDPARMNGVITELGRSDLVVAHPAVLMPIDHPADAVGRKTSNFAPKFKLFTFSESGELDIHDRAVRERVPVTEEELDDLRTLPLTKSWREYKGLRDTGRFPAISGNNHAVKPAFTRMLLLFGDFTKGLVGKVSAPENEGNYARFEMELYVAYQLMSRLVDTRDHRVTQNGEVDTWYLCH